ncbi:MAG TPA: flagellar hook-associated protein FlgL [Negativicutes bacterium]|nr:flagellar hook-associated protein FlgL [Negativicutes bacterium]
MRITNGMQSNSLLRSLQGSNERSYKLQEQLSTGRRINRPSDDPVGVSRSLKLNRDLSENGQYTRNVQDAMAFLDATDTALGGVGDILQRIQELAVSGANDSLPQASKNALADEVDELLGQLIQVANTTHSGVYIFAGEKVLTQPYAAVGAPATGVTYLATEPAGSGLLKNNFEIAPNVTDSVNYTGREIFGDETTANSIFDHLIQLRDALRTGTVADIQAVEGDLSADLDAVLSYRSTVGAKYNKMELSLNRLSSANVNITQQIADNDDTDIAYATMQLKLEENVYNAALAVGARVIPPSLVDFLS